MKKKIRCVLICYIAALLLLAAFPVTGYAAEEPVLITDYTSLMTAVNDAEEGDVLLVGDIDFSPLSPDVAYSFMYITIDKSITIKSGKPDGAAVFLNGGFVLSGSKIAGEKISVTFENIIFDGKAEYENLMESDYAYPWSETEQTYTVFAPLKAQQALSFKGNVDAEFSGCVFQNYMHECGPVMDIRYGDYTDNEYLRQLFTDYSGCRLTLTLEQCRIENNSALYDGGAFYIDSNNNVTLCAVDTVFTGNRCTVNSAWGGGAIFARGASLEFTECVFEKNTANYVFADSKPGEYDTHKGGALLLEDSKLTMLNTDILENRASMGGGISLTNAKADFTGSRFVRNRAEAYAVHPEVAAGPWSNMAQGGALYVEGNSNDTVSLTGCEIKENSAATAYGGIYGYYIPGEDASFGTYHFKMAFCTYEDNDTDAAYDYTAADADLWLSHPGDMFTNPHLTFTHCYITDAAFQTDFPHHDMPTEENGYNYLSAVADEAMRMIALPVVTETPEPTEVPTATPKPELTKAPTETPEPKVIETPTETPEPEATYAPVTETPLVSPADSDSSGRGGDNRDASKQGGLFWWMAGAVALILLGSIGVAAAVRRKAKAEAEMENAAAAEPPVEEKKQIVMTRYEDEAIDRFISLVPETHRLTGRELEVLREILRGKKQSEVAYYLGIEVSTVKDFYKKIYTKLEVSNKDSLLLKASETLKKEE